MNAQLAKQLELALTAYRGDRPGPGVDEEKRDGMEMISGTVRRLIEALEREDINNTKMEVLTFSRQASDVYFEQSTSFRKLAELIGKVRKEIAESVGCRLVPREEFAGGVEGNPGSD